MTIVSSLKNHGTDDQVNSMFDMGAEALALPLEEKMKFEQGDDGTSFGYSLSLAFDDATSYDDTRYKALGAFIVDEHGQQDSIEFFNISKDDALAWPKQAMRDYPAVINARMESIINPFIKKSIEINNTILDIFNDKLGLPPGEVLQRHNIHEFSGCEARVTRVPPLPQASKKALGSHTDFGSLVRYLNTIFK